MQRMVRVSVLLPGAAIGPATAADRLEEKFANNGRVAYTEM